VSGFPASYADVSGTANDAWAAGAITPGPYHRKQPLLMHWNGLAWSRVAFADDGKSDKFNGVAALGPADVWAIGSRQVSGNNALAEYWNGTSWTATTVPVPQGMASTGLNHISATSSTDVWALGTDYATDGGTAVGNYVAHWNGLSWKAIAVPSSANPDLYTWLRDMAAVAPNDLWLAGGTYSNSQADFLGNLTLPWDGAAWHTASAPSTGMSPTLLHIGGTSTNLWAVGNYWDTSTSTSKTTVLHSSGGGWSASTDSALSAATGLIRGAPGVVLLSGADSESGYILRSTS